MCSIFEDYGTWLVGTNSLGKGLITTALERLCKGSVESYRAFGIGWSQGCSISPRRSIQKARMSSESDPFTIGWNGSIRACDRKRHANNRAIGSQQRDRSYGTDSRAHTGRDQGPQRVGQRYGQSAFDRCHRLCHIALSERVGDYHVGSQDITLTASCVSGTEDMSMTRHCEVGTQRDLTGVTGWPLSGVDYTPTNTLDQDLLGTLKEILDSLSHPCAISVKVRSNCWIMSLWSFGT